MQTIHLNGSDIRADSIGAAIDRLAEGGGGDLTIPQGRWPIGGLRLRSRVRLHLAAGCTLDGVLQAENVEDIAVVGEGHAASSVTGGMGMDQVRGVECSGWSGRVVYGQNVRDGRFSGLKLHQPPQRQGEGSVVWFLLSANLHFEDCDLESNDDVFCLKRSAENVTLTRSRLCGRMAAPFKIGTESDGLFRNIVFTDSVIEKSDRAAITLESVDGAELCDVRIERIRMEDVNAPLFIRLGRRDRRSKGLGEIHDILISDIQGYGDTMDEGFGSCISGLPERAVRNIVLRDIRFVSRGGQPAALAGRSVPERPELYPEFDMFGRLPAHGLYARHVQGLRLERVALTAAAPDGRPAIALEDVLRVEVIDSPTPIVRPPAVAPSAPPLPPGDVDALFEAVRSARPGETVVVEPGDYAIPRERLPLMIDREGVVIRSREGALRTRIRAVGAREVDGQGQCTAPLEVARNVDTLFVVSADRVKICGLTLSAAVYNIYLGGVAGCEVADNRFDFAKAYHVYAWQGRGHVLVRNTSRAALTNSFTLRMCEECVIRENVFEEDPGAVRLTGSCRSEISANRFLGPSWHGVMLESGSHENRIRGNLFADGRLTGLQVRGSNANEVVGNEFRGQKTESVLVDGESRDTRLRMNSFHSNRGLAVSNETPYPVDAARNWWGSPSGPGPGAQVDANVIVSPWLTEPPAAGMDYRPNP